jgi:hypothetical protein
MNKFHGFSAAAFVFFVFLMGGTGIAQIVPYKLTGSGVADPLGGSSGLGAFYGPSISTHLGKMWYEAEATSLVFSGYGPGGEWIFDYTADDVQTAADGSEIFLSGAGKAYLTPRPDLGPTWFDAVWDGEWTVVGGSGRFANASSGTGPIILAMVQEPFDLLDAITLRPFTYTKTGDINLGRK